MSGNGNGKPHTAAGMLSALSEKLVGALPPALLVLVILNCLTLGLMGYLFVHNADTRNAMLSKIIEACLVQQR